MADQSAPAAADIKHPVAGLQAQFSADQIELVVLGLVERVVGLGEIAAGILHFLPEEKFIEVIADIVMELDEFLVVPPG